MACAAKTVAAALPKTIFYVDEVPRSSQYIYKPLNKAKAILAQFYQYNLNRKKNRMLLLCLQITRGTNLFHSADLDIHSTTDNIIIASYSNKHELTKHPSSQKSVLNRILVCRIIYSLKILHAVIVTQRAYDLQGIVRNLFAVPQYFTRYIQTRETALKYSQCGKLQNLKSCVNMVNVGNLQFSSTAAPQIPSNIILTFIV